MTSLRICSHERAMHMQFTLADFTFPQPHTRNRMRRERRFFRKKRFEVLLLQFCERAPTNTTHDRLCVSMRLCTHTSKQNAQALHTKKKKRIKKSKHIQLSTRQDQEKEYSLLYCKQSNMFDKQGADSILTKRRWSHAQHTKRSYPVSAICSEKTPSSLTGGCQNVEKARADEAEVRL